MRCLLHSWKLTICTAALVLGMIAPTPSEAYRLIQQTTVGRVSAGNLVTCNDPGGFVHWTTANIPWRLNTSGQGSGKVSAVQAALASWTNVSGANHNLTYAGTTTAAWATDGTNTVLWANGNGCTGNCLALTALVLQSGQVIVETDVTFNSNYTWTTNGTNYDTQTVATHEFGHALGIHHTELTSTPRPTMYASYFGSGGRTLETDDRAALQCSQSKYPVGSSGGGAPATPAWFNVQKEYCLGYVSLSWASSSGATYYEVQDSTSFSFAYAWLAYTGSATSKFYSHGVGTHYFRVRACNSSGCSAYLYGGSSRYYSICL